MAAKLVAAAAALLLAWALTFSQAARTLHAPLSSGGVVIVTGASTGVGLDACKELARLGYTVLGAARKEKDVAMLDGLGLKGLKGLLLDVTKPADAVAAVKAAEGMGKLVAVVNNAGVALDLPVELGVDAAGDLPHLRTTYEVNVFGAIRLTALALPALRRNSGRVVFVGSVAGRLGNGGQAFYSSSKHALEGFADSLRREMLTAGHAVSVTMVDPGCVNTAMFTNIDKNNVVKDVPAAQRSLYGRVFDRNAANLEKCRNGATPDQTTTPAIVDALTSAYPKTRYYPAGFDGLPASVIITLQWLLPDRVMDWVVTNF